ncbi:MAG: hypothetical protein R2695_00765 [Acidimicrobiales bacterium]
MSSVLRSSRTRISSTRLCSATRRWWIEATIGPTVVASLRAGTQTEIVWSPLISTSRSGGNSPVVWLRTSVMVRSGYEVGTTDSTHAWAADADPCQSGGRDATTSPAVGGARRDRGGERGLRRRADGRIGTVGDDAAGDGPRPATHPAVPADATVEPDPLETFVAHIDPSIERLEAFVAPDGEPARFEFAVHDRPTSVIRSRS